MCIVSRPEETSTVASLTDPNSPAAIQQNLEMTFEDPCGSASGHQAYIHIRSILMLPEFVIDHVLSEGQVPTCR